MKKLWIVIWKTVAVIGKIVAAAVLAVIAVAGTGYLFTPVYDFSEPRPFSGEALYNPYAGADFGEAKKAVLHFHTTLSDGKDAPDVIVGAYRDMGYEVISVADHDRITPAGIDPARELGTYEHGLNAYRFHNVVIGAERPDRFQLPLWQCVSGREETLRRLDARFPLVVLNHPAGVRRLSQEQMERLSHYDYIEADRGMDRELPPWDAALSAGHYSFVMAGDDLHDLGRSYPVGRAMTFIMTPSAETGPIMKALEAGHTYAVRIARPSQIPDSLYIPRVTDFEVTGDTLRVALSDPARIRFTGQGGAVRREVFSDEASYVFGGDDTYIRVEARLEGGDSAGLDFGAGAGGTSIYLNPVARYSPSTGGGDKPSNASYSVLNLPLTILSAAGHALLMLACLGTIYLLFRKKRKARRWK